MGTSSKGVRGVTSEQSSYHKLRLVLRGDLDLLSNLFLGVLLDVDLTGDTCMNLVFGSPEPKAHKVSL